MPEDLLERASPGAASVDQGSVDVEEKDGGAHRQL